MKRFIICISLLLLCSPGAFPVPCDPALATSGKGRSEGSQVIGQRGCTWHLVTEFSASMNLCTGYAADCGDGPCNALEAWGYTWQVWEVVKGGAVISRSGCISSVNSRTATGKCCGGGDTTKPTKPVVRTKTMPYTSSTNLSPLSEGGCGCKNMPVKNEQDRKTCMKDCHSK